MSDENTARHAECTVEFDGVDITSSIAPYLLSLSFTDNEEDASDDLQIKLQDRDGAWMNDWLQKMIDGDVSAASSDGYKVGDVVQFLGGPHYKASTDKKANGNPKAGPAKITIIKQGALHPYHVIHTDGTSRVYGWVDASEISGKSGGGSSGSSSGSGEESLKIRATITACNWHSDGKDEALDCGTFELDSVVASGPPGIITIKAIGLPYTSQIRQTKQSKGWEKYKLSGIANEMASKNGMTTQFLAKKDPEYKRVEQYRCSDIDFLQQLCHDAGLSLKCTDGKIVIFDQQEYEGKDAVWTTTLGDKSYIKYAQVRGMEQAACRNRKVVGELAQYRQGQLENIGNQPSRAFFSGCSWNNPSNGLGSFNGNNPRSNVDDDIGFRAALPPSQILQAQGLALSAEVIKGLVPLVAFRGLKILASQSAFRRYKRTAHAVRRPQGVGFFGKAPTRFRAFCNVRQFV